MSFLDHKRTSLAMLAHTSFADWGVRCALEGGLLMERQCDHLGSSLLSPLVAGNIRSTAPSHIFSAGSFSPAKWSAASFTKAAGRESLSGFRYASRSFKTGFCTRQLIETPSLLFLIATRFLRFAISSKPPSSTNLISRPVNVL